MGASNVIIFVLRLLLCFIVLLSYPTPCFGSYGDGELNEYYFKNLKNYKAFSINGDTIPFEKNESLVIS